MLEYLQSIPGPIFLKFYLGIVVISAIIIVAVDFLKDRFSGSYNLTEFELTPLETAVMLYRGNQEKIALSYIFHLWEQKTIKLLQADDDSYLFVRNDDAADNPAELPESVLECFKEAINAEELLYSDNFKEHLTMLIEIAKEKLEELGMIKSETDRNSSKAMIIVIGVFVAAIGTAKAAMGLYFGRPTELLIIIIVAYAAFIYWRAFHQPYITLRGHKQLKSLSGSYKAYINAPTEQASFSPVMLGMLFGFSALSIYPEYAIIGSLYNTLLPMQPVSPAGDSGYYFYSDSGNFSGGDSGGDSGGGCSSCSSCSGCGGCGGD